MRLIRKFSRWNYIALLLLVSLAAGVGSAQLIQRPVYQGKFTLPHAAEWGGVAIPAGDYVFEIHGANSPATLSLYQERKGKTSFITSLNIAGYPSNHRSSLVVVRKAGRLTVRCLRVRELGREYTFANAQAQTLIAQQPELMQRIDVSAAGKKS